MTKVLKLGRYLAIGLSVLVLSAGIAIGQDSKKPVVEKGVFWADQASGVQVFLTEGGQLTVVSNKSVRVDYHTSINSSRPVDKQLTSTGSGGPSVTYFDARHNFSRTTIWMALEFTIDGKKVPELTRTFYNSIFETVANGSFMKAPK